MDSVVGYTIKLALKFLCDEGINNGEDGDYILCC